MSTSTSSTPPPRSDGVSSAIPTALWLSAVASVARELAQWPAAEAVVQALVARGSVADEKARVLEALVAIARQWLGDRILWDVGTVAMSSIRDAW